MLQKIKQISLENVSRRILIGVVFLLPIFAMPFGIFPVDFNKAMFFYIALSISFSCFLLSSLHRGSIEFPKNFVIGSLFFVVVIFFFSAIFSGNAPLSLVGVGYETGTFVSVFFLAIVAFLVAVIFRSIEQVSSVYRYVLLSSLILFVVQFLHSGFGVALPSWDMFQGRLESVLGNWNDMGIFFGLIVILALTHLEFGHGKKSERVLWRVSLVLSLVAVFFVNFSTMQYVLGFSVLAILVHRLVYPPYVVDESDAEKFGLFHISFFVFLLIVLFSVFHGWIGALVTTLGLEFSQVTPSWTATFDVIRGALSTSPLLGSGPNTFSYDWLIFKPSAILNTEYWNTIFSTGVGRLPSMIAETGLLGGAGFFMFICALLYNGKDVVSYREHNTERMLLVASFLGTIYLWTFTVIYSPGVLIFVFAGVFTGLFVSSLGLIQKANIAQVSLTRGTRKGFLRYFITILILAGSLYSAYFFTSKYFAGYFYTTALRVASVNGDINSANMYLNRTVRLDPQDVYYRSATEAGLFTLGQIIARTNETEKVSDADKNSFSNLLSYTVQSAKNATELNPRNGENWMELGKVYETLLQFDKKGFRDSAIFAYNQAIQVSPQSPLALLALARVELNYGNSDSALNYLRDSLKIKGDFVAGHIMLADIAVSQGKLKDAILELEKTVLSNPNNPENIYITLRIGVLYYQDGEIDKARKIFEKIVSLSPNFIDARYALGLIYEKNNMRDDAILQFEAIHALVPDNLEVQNILDNLRAKMDEVVVAESAPPKPEASANKTVKKTTKKK